MGWVFNRIYDGIVVDERASDAVVEASRKGPLVFCPAHRSHVDYLVLSYVLWEHGIAPPHIAAGANLSFFPLGTLFRRRGAFFLRRSFGDDALYRAVFRAYVAELIAAAPPSSSFIEGGRSRTGKLLLPKFGILSMVVDAWRAGARETYSSCRSPSTTSASSRPARTSASSRAARRSPEDLGGAVAHHAASCARATAASTCNSARRSPSRSSRAGTGLPQSRRAEHDEAWRAEMSRLGYRILSRIGQVCTVTPDRRRRHRAARPPGSRPGAGGRF